MTRHKRDGTKMIRNPDSKNNIDLTMTAEGIWLDTMIYSFIVAGSSPTTIYSLNGPSAAVSAYFPIVYNYIANGPTETIIFGLRNDPATTYISDISVTSNGVELLCNGGFQSGTEMCWQGACHIRNGCGYSSPYCYADAVVGSLDYISQTFSTTPGAALNISFWTYWTGSGSGVITTVTISP